MESAHPTTMSVLDIVVTAFYAAAVSPMISHPAMWQGAWTHCRISRASITTSLPGVCYEFIRCFPVLELP